MAVSFESLQEYLVLNIDWKFALDLLNMCYLILSILKSLKSIDCLDELNILLCLIITLLFRFLVKNYFGIVQD